MWASRAEHGDAPVSHAGAQLVSFSLSWQESKWGRIITHQSSQSWQPTPPSSVTPGKPVPCQLAGFRVNPQPGSPVSQQLAPHSVGGCRLGPFRVNFQPGSPVSQQLAPHSVVGCRLGPAQSSAHAGPGRAPAAGGRRAVLPLLHRCQHGAHRVPALPPQAGVLRRGGASAAGELQCPVRVRQGMHLVWPMLHKFQSIVACTEAGSVHLGSLH